MTQAEYAIDLRSNLSLTRMTEHDLLEVVEIEDVCGLSAWGWESYHKELVSGPFAIMIVARVNDVRVRLAEGKYLAGFIVARIVTGELHINNVAVRPEWRRLGIASRLLNAAMEQALADGGDTAFLEVRASNQVAQELYRHCGFHIVGRRKNYYREPQEDALIMSASLKIKA
jgi:[ribosomal protein S18]-alanine N-acetyltransferase